MPSIPKVDRFLGHIGSLEILDCLVGSSKHETERNFQMKRLVMLAVAIAAAMMAIAETEKVGGYTWTYRINGDTAGSLV